MHSDKYTNRSDEYACKIYKKFTGKSLKKEEKRVMKLEEEVKKLRERKDYYKSKIG